jgi:hypothetical protein
MVGSDYPFPIAERPVGSGVLAAGLADEEQTAVLTGTAADLFGLR